MYYLPTYNECVSLCKDDMPFYESKLIVDGYNVSLFNYRLATYSDFISTPFSKEMRGICFVFNTDGTLYKRYLLLNKFFNLNQVPESLYSVVKDYKIKSISTKEDGSIVSFIELPNGRIVGRTKMGFENDQSISINKIYNSNMNVKRFVDYCISMNYSPIFEYVSPFNKIVLNYIKDDLILLKVRNNADGNYLDVKNLDTSGINVANDIDSDISLDSLISYVNELTDKEGFVVNCLDNNGDYFMFKMKTPWYFLLHGILTEDVNRENAIIKNILNETIDDVLSKIPEYDTEVINKINSIIVIVTNYFNKRVNDIEKMYNEFLESGLSRKEYALLNKNNENFSFVINLMNGDDPVEKLKNYLLRKTYRLENARTWLDNINI
jgi:T4 RnlA family RNA ligase